MNRACWWLAGKVANSLGPEEREAVCGDLAESGEGGGAALRELMGLAMRRQAGLWKDWRPWLSLMGLIGPVGLLLTICCSWLDRSYDLNLWIFRNYGDIDPDIFREMKAALPLGVLNLAGRSLLLAGWAWSSGFVLALLARRTVRIQGTLFCVVLLAGERLANPTHRQYLYSVTGGLFSLSFYRVILPLMLQAVLVIGPALWGMYHGQWRGSQRAAKLALWAAALATALAGRTWFWWPHRSDWQMQVLLLAMYWPLAFLVASAIGRSRYLTDHSEHQENHT